MGILFTVVIPKITKIFEDTKITLPWTTRALIGLRERSSTTTGGSSCSWRWAEAWDSSAGARRRPAARAGIAAC